MKANGYECKYLTKKLRNKKKEGEITHEKEHKTFEQSVGLYPSAYFTGKLRYKQSP